LVQYNDPQRRIQRVDIDYGTDLCAEAIDQLTLISGTGMCSDSTAPTITITSR
jgi:hypothetical protein